MQSHGLVGHGFADDTCTMIGGNNLHQMMSRMQKVVNELIIWGNSTGLKFNADKTVVIIFSKSTIKPENYPNKLIMEGKAVNFSQSTKYLGVHLDAKLLWSVQSDTAIKRAKNYIFMLMPHLTKKWGP